MPPRKTGSLADFGCTVVVRFDRYTPVIGISRDFESEAAFLSVFGGLLNDQLTVIDAFCLKAQIGRNGGLPARKSRHALNGAVYAFPNGNGIRHRPGRVNEGRSTSFQS